MLATRASVSSRSSVADKSAVPTLTKNVERRSPASALISGSPESICTSVSYPFYDTMESLRTIRSCFTSSGSLFEGSVSGAS
jgi:hypothetical protein